MIKKIDNFLNNITMYRLVLYGLGILAGVTLILSLFNFLPFNPIQLLFSLGIVLASCFISNLVFSKISDSVTNFESYLISALILFLVIAPINDLEDGLITFAAGVLAMGSKYILAINKKHLFNPVAIALVIIGLLGFGNSIWWVGSFNLLPFVAVLGLLVVRKIRRFYLMWSFLATSIVTLSLFNLKNGIAPADSLIQIFSSWPLIFLGAIMLTEPLTSPPTQKKRIVYGGVVGILFGSQFSFGPIFSSPELSLVIGNMVSYLMSPKQKLFSQFKEKREIGPNLYELNFNKTAKFNFLAGQYLEWTLPLKSIDSRGNRRFFTIASSPTEEDIKLGIKVFPEKSSSFKNALVTLKKDDSIVGSQLTGDFTLPEDKSKKLVFIAGGIGVTPFRSMTKFMLDTGQSRDVVFFYACVKNGEFVYKEIFAEAEKKMAFKSVYVLTGQEIPSDWSGEKGYLNPGMVKKHIPDYLDRVFYLSGPNVMVDSYKSLLGKMGVRHHQIVTDYFSGY